MASSPWYDSLPPPSVYPSNSMSLPTKMRPVWPGGSGRPSGCRITTRVPCGGRPAHDGSRRSSAGVAMVACEVSVEP